MNSDQEFLALATANLASSLGQGFPTSGGMSQSLVNESSGAKTPLSGLVTSLLILIVILFFSGLLGHLPQPILAAIVMIAVISLLKIDTLRQMWSFSRADFAVAMTALIGVLSSGLLMGVLYGAILSLILLVRRAMHPHSTELGRVPESSFFADCLRHPENQRIPGVFVFRNDSAILYFNADHVRERFFDLLQSRPLKIHTVIFHLGSVPLIDFAGVELLDEIRESLAHQDIRFRIAEAHSGVRDTLRRAGFEKHYGPIRPDQTVDTILSELSAPTPTPTSPQP